MSSVRITCDQCLQSYPEEEVRALEMLLFPQAWCESCRRAIAAALAASLPHGGEPLKATVVLHQEQPPGEGPEWGGAKCKCGHTRRNHLHGKGSCLAGSPAQSPCRCCRFTLPPL